MTAVLARRPANDAAPGARTPGLGLLEGITGAEVTPALLTHWWSRLSAEFFDDALPAARIEVARCRSPRSLSESSCDVRGWLVRLAPRVAEHGELYAVAQLLHEAIHVWCRETHGDDETQYDGHGPRWCTRANAVAQRLRLSVLTRPSGGRGYLTPGAWPGVWDERPTLRVAPPASTPASVQQASVQQALPFDDTALRAQLDAARAEVARLREREAHQLDALRAQLERAELEATQARHALEQRDGIIARVVEAVQARRDEHQRDLDAYRRRGVTSGGNVALTRKLLADADHQVVVVAAIVGTIAGRGMELDRK